MLVVSRPFNIHYKILEILNQFSWALYKYRLSSFRIVLMKWNVKYKYTWNVSINVVYTLPAYHKAATQKFTIFFHTSSIQQPYKVFSRCFKCTLEFVFHQAGTKKQEPLYQIKFLWITAAMSGRFYEWVVGVFLEKHWTFLVTTWVWLRPLLKGQ